MRGLCNFVFPREWEKSEVYSFGINGIMGKYCDCQMHDVYPTLNALNVMEG